MEPAYQVSQRWCGARVCCEIRRFRGDAVLYQSLAGSSKKQFLSTEVPH